MAAQTPGLQWPFTAASVRITLAASISDWFVPLREWRPQPRKHHEVGGF
jgi:hypothetical protein